MVWVVVAVWVVVVVVGVGVWDQRVEGWSWRDISAWLERNL